MRAEAKKVVATHDYQYKSGPKAGEGYYQGDPAATAVVPSVAGKALPLNQMNTMGRAQVLLWKATGLPLAELCAPVDTVSVCFSKGLGAPVGSVLVSTAERIQRARVTRRMTGGAMRQVGILAAAADYAWRHHLADLAGDHERARRLAQRLGRVAPRVVDPTHVETNIVVLDLHGSQWDAPALAAAARQTR